MILFLSEICRLILGFLEDEQLFNTYNSFLNECKHLEECHIYISRGIQFSTKINGKSLRDYLHDYNSLDHVDTMTQTTANNSTDSSTQTEENLNPVDLELVLNQQHLASAKSQSQLGNRRKKKTQTFTRKDYVLTTPTKKDCNPISTNVDASSSCSESENNDNLIDIDFFIQNLCKNDFPEQLAKSINDIKAKKNDEVPIKSISDRLEKKLASFKPKPVPKQNAPDPLNTGQVTRVSITPAVQLDTNLVSILNMSGSSQSQSGTNIDSSLNFFDFDDINAAECGPNMIGNEDISYLADYFSEPAYETLYGTVTGNCNLASEQVKDSSSDIVKVSMSESRKSMIVIANSKEDLDKAEKELRNTGKANAKSMREMINSSGDVLEVGKYARSKRKRDYFEDFTDNLKVSTSEKASSSFN